MGPFDVVNVEDCDGGVLHGSWILGDAAGPVDGRSDGWGFHLGRGLSRAHGRLGHGVGHGSAAGAYRRSG